MSAARSQGLVTALVLAAAGLAQADTPTTALESALKACAAIASPEERLTCYDRLAGRTTAPRSAAAIPPAVAPPPAPAAATATATPSATPGAPPAAAPAIAGAPSTGAPPPAPPQSFGLYAAEHPAPPPAATSMSGRVAFLGHSPSGRLTVSLEDGQVWELDDGDPVLAVGDLVTIRRATFGSFLMDTPSKREHRARRLH